MHEKYRYFFYVYADGQKIYSYHPVISSLYGSSYGMFFHQVFVPEQTKQLKIKIIPAFENVPGSFNETMISDPGMYVTNVLKRGMLGFCTCLVMFILGIVTVIAGFIRRNETEFITLGMFAVLAAVWSVNNTLFLQLLTDNPALIRFLNYITLILLPYPPVSFLSKMTKSRSILIPILNVAVALNFTLSIILTVWKVTDYHELLPISQVIVLLSVGVVVFHILQAIRQKTIPEGFFPVTVIGSSTAIAGVMIDLVRYNIKANGIQSSGGFTRIGISLFLIILTIYLIKDYSRVKMEGEKAELMEKLAHTDALTGLKNRLSFNEAEMVMKAESTSCFIVQLDINDLKKVNDFYGHSEGDKHICAAADIIRESFDKIGVCYRTGGDEFITVAVVSAKEHDVIAAIQRLKKRLPITTKRVTRL